jgi:hypothetical protein
VTEGAAIVINQDVDAAGAPAPARFRRDIAGTLTFSRWASAVDFLVRLGASRGAQSGEFVYNDPSRGSGQARLEGFDDAEVRRIDDYFRVEEMRVRLDLPRSARQPLDIRTFWTRPGSTNNPIPMIVLGTVVGLVAVVLGVASSLGPMRVPGETVTWVYLPLFGVLVVGAVVVIVQHVRRLPSWFALRQAFRDAGEPLPIGLRNGD